MNPLQAVILAGGLGTRLGTITKETPKPLVNIKGKPFLEWQLQFLADQGVKKFLLLTGYKGEMIENYFGNGKKWGFNISYSQEALPLGTGGALLQAVPKLADRFLLLFGDSFLPVSSVDLFEKLVSR